MVVHAQTIPSVIINEVCWAGSSISSADEWIELKNISSETINVRGWQIEHAASSGKTLYLPDDNDYNIAPRQYFLIANYDNSNDHSVLATKPDIVDTGLSLLNTNNNNLILKNSQDEVIDEVISNPWPAGTNDPKASMERIDDLDGLNIQSWQTANLQTNLEPTIVDFATPKAENSQSMFNIPTFSNEYLATFINFDNVKEAKAIVTEVVDGDIIEVSINNLKYKVRLIGVDAPESSISSMLKIDEPYYLLSKQYTIDTLLNNEIRLFVNSDKLLRYDDYGRLLGLVIIDGRLFNIDQINTGFARKYSLNDTLIHSDAWVQSEQIAKNNFMGIWSDLNNKCIIINEFMPNPSGEDKQKEWIELKNVCQNDVNIKNWIIDDGEDGSNPYLIDNNTVIKANNYCVINAKDSNIILNNNYDSVRLFTPDLNIADDIKYQEDAKEDMSYALINNKWQWTNFLSPGADNIVQDNAENTNYPYSKIDKISNLRKIKKSTKVEISGLVNVEPGILGKQYFYIQDDSGGVQIYYSEADFPDITVGDNITVKGELSDTLYLRIKIDKKEDIIATGNKTDVTAKKINQENYALHEGKLIKIIGKVISKKGKNISLNIDNSSINIQFKSNVKMPKITVDDMLEIIGIVSLNSDNEYVILPRYQSDIVNLTQRQVEKNEYINIEDKEQLAALRSGSLVKFKGVITCLPGMIDDRYFYIQSQNLAMQIYNGKKDFPMLSLQQEVEVYGKISKKFGRIIVSDINNIKNISSDNNLHSLEIADNNLTDLYQNFVYIEGTVSSKHGNTYLITKDTQYPIYIKNKVKNGKTIKVGDYIEAYGIVEQYSDGLKITVRSNNDLFIFPVTKQIKLNTVKNNLASYKNQKNKVFLKPVKINKYLDEPSNNHYNNWTINNILLSISFSSILLIIIIRFIYYDSKVSC